MRNDEPTDCEDLMRRMCQAISKYRIRMSTEAEAQADVEKALLSEGIVIEPQKVLSPKDRVDVFSEGVAMEIKVKGSRAQIYRQLERYAALPEVSGVVLVTGVAWPFQGGDINGKPFMMARLGSGWL